jgi:hypothetical protein
MKNVPSSTIEIVARRIVPVRMSVLELGWKHGLPLIVFAML